MIRFLTDYEAILGRRSGLRGLAAIYAASAVLQGLTILALVPLLTALLEGRGSATVWFIAMVLCGFGSLALFTWAIQRAYAVCMDDLFTLTARIGRTVVKLPLGWFTADSGAKANQAALGDCDQLSHLPPIVLPNVVTALISPTVVLVGMLVLDWRMAVALLIALPFLWLINRWMDRTAAAVSAREAASDERIAGTVLEFAALQPVLRAAGGDRGLGRVGGAIEENNAAVRAAQSRKSRPLMSFLVLTHAATVAALAVGAYLALGGQLAMPAFLAMAVFCIRFAEPVAMLPGYLSEFAGARTSVRRIADIVCAEPLPEPAEPATPQGYGIELDDVSFAYASGTPTVLDHVSLDCPQGTVTALVGPSGCGKSTILRLIGRFHDVDSGAIRIGGADVRDLGTAAVMDMTAMVFQDVYLFEGTIADNVRMGKPDATEAELTDAARRARLDEVIDRLPGGWDAQVGEGGGRLSGGERQRVAIARALLKDSPILLLDEVTSSLDGANEAAVTAAIRELAEGRTTILIAHRLSTVTGADTILVMDSSGRITDRGTHAELAGRSGIYAQFLEDQRAGAAWQLTDGR